MQPCSHHGADQIIFGLGIHGDSAPVGPDQDVPGEQGRLRHQPRPVDGPSPPQVPAQAQVRGGVDGGHAVC